MSMYYVYFKSSQEGKVGKSLLTQIIHFSNGIDRFLPTPPAMLFLAVLRGKSHFSSDLLMKKKIYIFWRFSDEICIFFSICRRNLCYFNYISMKFVFFSVIVWRNLCFFRDRSTTFPFFPWPFDEICAFLLSFDEICVFPW